MIGFVAFVALAVSAAYGQGCSSNGLSQAVVVSPVSGFSGNVLGSGIVNSGFGSGIVGSGLSGNLGFGVVSAPSVRSSVVSAPVFLNDGPALLNQATRVSGPLVATPAVSQSVSPVGSVSGSVSGASTFNSAVGPDQIVSVPNYATPRIPSTQVSLPSFGGVSSLNYGSAISSPVFAQSVSTPVVQAVSTPVVAQTVSTPVVAQAVSTPVVQAVSTPVVSQAVSTPVVAQTVSVPVSSGVFGSGISGFGSGVVSSGVVGSGCY